MKSILALVAFGFMCPWGVEAKAAIVDCQSPLPVEISRNSTEAVIDFNKSLDTFDVFC